MEKLIEEILDMLTTVPWWVSVILSGIVYLLVAFVLPMWESDNLFLQAIIKGVPPFAPYVALIFLLPAPVSIFKRWQKRRLLDRQKGIESIRELSWKQFEELVGEAYRRQGYRVQENHQPGPDGGVDLRLRKDGQQHIVQCKRWKTQKVGVRVVREMYGIMVAECAASVIVISSGYFTQEAKNFANSKPIDLVDGAQLTILVGQVQSTPNIAPPVQVSPPPIIEPPTDIESCPKCGGDLILRTAKRGPNPGSQFYGCSSYPKCRYTRTYGS